MSENVIVADAGFVNKVAFDLIVNFERMLGRRIPQADMARWVECVALDGGLREKQPAGGDSTDKGNTQTDVILVHDRELKEMDNFSPGRFDGELDGKAFRGRLGEFSFSAPCGEAIVSTEDLFLDTLQTVLQQKEVRRLMVIPDDRLYNSVREIIRRADGAERGYDDASAAMRHVTVFAMQPMAGGPFRQEILGYSLMAALGIRSEEINAISK